MMTFHRKTLFDGLRAGLKPAGGFNQKQVTSIGVIVDEFERRKLPDVRWLAYILATVWHECRFESIAEIGKGKGKPYGKPHPKTGKVYYGRGFVQITWFDNYLKFQSTLNLPLIDDPDMALMVPVATAILYEGMTTGVTAKDSFTKWQLHDFLNATKDDPIGARRIINGKDKAKLIAGYHATILGVLQSAKRDAPLPTFDDAPAQPPADLDVPKPSLEGGGIGGAAGGSAGYAASEVIGLSGWWAFALIVGAVVVGAVLALWLTRKFTKGKTS